MRPRTPLAAALAIPVALTLTATIAAAQSASPAPKVLADFDTNTIESTNTGATDPLSGTWRTVNDNIMGGRSLGGGTIHHGVMTFAGSTNTNGGGFSSVRAGNQSLDLSAYEGLAARVRADGRTYVFHIHTGLSASGSNVFYRGEFTTTPLLTDRDATPNTNAEHEVVFVPFDDFVPMIRGRDVTGRVPALDPERITSIGLMIDDGLDGPFRLDADWILATKAPTNNQASAMIKRETTRD